jgi:light-regulated signal transduction histidine kinase (bacteriophytochrome)
MNTPQEPIFSLPLTLDNCAAEPIHIPGMIQPHGAMLVFDTEQQLIAWSANVVAMLKLTPVAGTKVSEMALPAAVAQLVQGSCGELADGEAPASAIEIEIGTQQFDCIAHVYQGRVIVEFEMREVAVDKVAMFALHAHSVIDRLKRQKSIGGLLQLAAEQVRSLTGFDRVMAYRFRQDDSGDVVAESRIDSLDPYLGRRYPASDIPAQARRLYIINTLRLIADANYKPVPISGVMTGAPLDMSYSVLRSVSPVHLEYLRNMGVGASMSVSIVVNGRLWGMLACHHMSARQVPYSIRMAIDVLAQVLASAVQMLEARAHADLVESASAVRSRLMETLLNEDDVLPAFVQHGEAICGSLKADALLATEGGRLVIHGDVSKGTASAIVAALQLQSGAVGEGSDIVEYNMFEEWPEATRALLENWVGALALRFDPASQGWLIALRREQIESIKWGGRPEKQYQVGPLGPRLTPRGSFDEWRETVRGSAEPWEPIYRTIATQLITELHRAASSRHAENDRIRTQLLAMLGHDLRDPLNSINMVGLLLEHGKNEPNLGRRIQDSSGRMSRLISQVLDMSRINSGVGLYISPAETNLVALLQDVVDEARLAHPGVHYEARLPDSAQAKVDPDRIAQVLSNLLGNAAYHGAPDQPVQVALSQNESHANIKVTNIGQPIDVSVVQNLFNPFKRGLSVAKRKRTGIGLGLYIAHEIVKGHGGRIEYQYVAPHVVFSVDLPLTAVQEAPA